VPRQGGRATPFRPFAGRRHRRLRRGRLRVRQFRHQPGSGRGRACSRRRLPEVRQRPRRRRHRRCSIRCARHRRARAPVSRFRDMERTAQESRPRPARCRSRPLRSGCLPSTDRFAMSRRRGLRRERGPAPVPGLPFRLPLPGLERPEAAPMRANRTRAAPLTSQPRTMVRFHLRCPLRTLRRRRGARRGWRLVCRPSEKATSRGAGPASQESWFERLVRREMACAASSSVCR